MITSSSQVMGVAFAIVISEKGGAERREDYHQSELNIGRVQGNDLMLPKGNVSKRHAQLVYREGRFIVRDLNSTNGTYVNRRRINQATLVRQGDRIYIGDFVLRLEVEGEESSGPLVAERRSLSPLPIREQMGTLPDASHAPARSTGAHRYPPVPPAPKVPSGAQLDGGPSLLNAALGSSDRTPSGRDDSIDVETTAYRGALRAVVEQVNGRLEERLFERDLSEAAASRVEQTITEQVETLRTTGVVPAHVVQARLVADARAELIELGPLTSLLSDETVSEISVAGLHSVSVVRGTVRSRVEPPFSTELTLQRALARLCRQAGAAPGSEEALIRRQLPSGFSMTALAGSATGGRALIRFERPQSVDATLEDLVRAGTVSRAIATFFKQAVGARANVLIVGSREARPVSVLSALATAVSDAHVVALQSQDKLASNTVSVSNIDISDAELTVAGVVEFAASMPEARLVIGNLAGGLALGTMDAIGAGADGVVAVLPAHSIRRGLARLPTELAGCRPGLTPAAAREWVAASFDLLVEVAVLRDGRQRVLRIAEPRGVVDGEIRVQDVFAFSIERTASGGSVEGTFQATGAVPRLMDELTARGISVDTSLFTRPPSR